MASNFAPHSRRSIDSLEAWRDSMLQAANAPHGPTPHETIERAEYEMPKQEMRKAPPRLYSKRVLILEWRWEFSVWALGTTAFVTIIGLLVHFHNKRLSDWHSDLQITTIVATLAQVVQSALLVPISYSISQLKWNWFRQTGPQPVMDIVRFDQASRGPDGALRLLYRLKWRPRLVSLGALATVLMLGFPPFTQQAVQTGLEDTPFQTNDATVAYSTYYAGKVAYVPEFLGLDGNDDTMRAIDAYLNGAVNSGLSDEYRSPSNISASCPTSKCTFEPYTTLAICSSVEENPLLSKQDLDKFANFSMGAFNNSVETFWMRAQIGSVSEPETYNGTDERIKAIGGPSIPREAAAAFGGGGSEIARIHLFYYDPCLGGQDWDGKSKPYPWQDVRNWKGYMATIRWCLQTYKTTYNSSTKTEVVESYTDLKWPGTPQTPDEKCFPFFSDEDTYCFPSCATSPTGQKYCAESGGLGGSEYLGMSFRSAFNITASYANLDEPTGPNDPQEVYYTQWSPQLVADVVGNNASFCTNDTGRGKPGFEKRMNNVAVSLTNALRTYNSTLARGTAWKTEQFIKVNFLWLIMPVSVYLGATIFFFATVYQARSVPIWKASPLALLQCLDDKNALAEMEEFEKAARNTNVQLEHTGTTWYLEHPRGNFS